MCTSPIIEELEFLENTYIATINSPAEVEEYYALIANVNLPTPKKFLEDGLAESIAKELEKQGAHPEKIWLLPFDYGELDESRNTIIVISISPDNVDESADDAVRIHHLVRNLLRHQKVGRPNTFVIWDYALENCNNPVYPRYAPTWKKNE